MEKTLTKSLGRSNNLRGTNCASHSQLANGKILAGFQKTEIKTDEYEDRRKVENWVI